MAVLNLARNRRLVALLAARDEFPVPLKHLWLIAPAGYVIFMWVAITHHEPWADEAQAWLLARDLNPITLMRFLPYEGTPGLWHLLLMAPAKLLPYATMNIISAAMAGVATYLLLRHSPFPLVVKLLLPFTYFLFFQYGVVARNYALMPPLMFLVALKYPERHTNPYRFMGLLFLMANVSAHGYLIAGALMLLSFLDLVRKRQELDSKTRRTNLISLAAFGILMALVAFTLRPPPDRTAAPMGEASGPWAFFKEAGIMLKESMGNSVPLVIVAMLISLWFFQRRRVLGLYLLPTFWIIAFSAYVYSAAWHQGILFLVWVFVFWIALQQREESDMREHWIRILALSVLVVVSAVQISWSIKSVRSDFKDPYSGSKAAAKYIKAHSLDDKVVWGYGFATIALLPYFDRNIYDNYHGGLKPSFWLWSTSNDMVNDLMAVEGVRPDYLVMDIKGWGGEVAVNNFPSYHVLETFPGTIFWKSGVLEPESFVLLELDKNKRIS